MWLWIWKHHASEEKCKFFCVSFIVRNFADWFIAFSSLLFCSTLCNGISDLAVQILIKSFHTPNHGLGVNVENGEAYHVRQKEKPLAVVWKTIQNIQIFSYQLQICVANSTFCPRRLSHSRSLPFSFLYYLYKKLWCLFTINMFCPLWKVHVRIRMFWNSILESERFRQLSEHELCQDTFLHAYKATWNRPYLYQDCGVCMCSYGTYVFLKNKNAFANGVMQCL